MKKLILTTLLFSCLNAFGAPPAATATSATGTVKTVAQKGPMTFIQWKNNQVVDAENKSTRLANKLHLLKTSYYQLVDKNKSAAASKNAQSAEALNARSDMKSKQDEIEVAEKQLTVAKEHLQFTKELKMEHYVAVYLTQFKDQPEALKLAAKGMSKEEVQQLLQIALSQNGDTRPAPKAEESDKSLSLSDVTRQPEPPANY